MKIKGQLQWTDYLQSQLLHLQPSGWVRIVVYAFVAFWGCAFMGGLYLASLGKFRIELMIPGIILVAFIIFYRFVLLPKQVQRIFSQQKELNAPFELEMADAGLSISNEFGNSNRPWGNFIKWKENKDLLLLYHSDVLYSILPKRLFADPQQVDSIKAHLQRGKVPAASSRSQIGCVAVVVLFLILAVVALLFQLRATP